jgi:hypothetical protein
MANPKNPVRAARQAGRQQVRAAKDARKVAKIETKVASKVAKISGSPAAKPVAKTTSAPVAKPAATKARPGIKGRVAEARYNKQAKNKKAAPISYSPTKLPDSPKPTLKITNDMRGTLKEMPAETRKAPAKKKGPSASEKNIIKMWKDRGYTYGKDGKVRDKDGKTPEENETQRVKDMFLQPGETRQNTSPFASKEVAAKRALKDALDKVPFGKKKAGGSVKKYQTGGKVDPYTTKPTATASMYKRSGVTLKKNADGTYTKAKSGGSVKRK